MLQEKILFVFIDRLIILKIHSAISVGNQKMANKVTAEDKLYINSRRISLMEQWKSKKIFIWVNLV